jgi:hypothetical protein
MFLDLIRQRPFFFFFIPYNSLFFRAYTVGACFVDGHTVFPIREAFLMVVPAFRSHRSSELQVFEFVI